MGETLAQAAEQFAFNKDQVRGPNGQWIKVGSLVNSAEHGTGEVQSITKDGKVKVSFTDTGADVGEVLKTVSPQTLNTLPRLNKKERKVKNEAATKRLESSNSGDY